MNLLLTGGAGYIGSHTCVALLARGHNVTVLDDFSNSRPEALKRIARVAARSPVAVRGNVRDIALLSALFAESRFDAVLHFAGRKAVGESVTDPLGYYSSNFAGTVTLLQAMRNHGVRTLVFSSSATVYGTPALIPVREDAPFAPTNPYGQSKAMVEQMLADLCTSDEQWRVACLRYFNPAGAHQSGLLGEDPADTPNNLVPFIAQVAEGSRPHLSVFGNDYATADGTGVRDYIHISDLVEGHIAALRHLHDHRGLHAFNLGTGTGTSVLEMVRAFERASGRPIPYRIAPRRPGDIAACWADATRAERILDWRATRSLDDMCRDTWRWRCNHRRHIASPCSNLTALKEAA